MLRADGIGCSAWWEHSSPGPCLQEYRWSCVHTTRHMRKIKYGNIDSLPLMSCIRLVDYGCTNCRTGTSSRGSIVYDESSSSDVGHDSCACVCVTNTVNTNIQYIIDCVLCTYIKQVSGTDWIIREMNCRMRAWCSPMFPYFSKNNILFLTFQAVVSFETNIYNNKIYK